MREIVHRLVIEIPTTGVPATEHEAFVDHVCAAARAWLDEHKAERDWDEHVYGSVVDRSFDDPLDDVVLAEHAVRIGDGE